MQEMGARRRRSLRRIMSRMSSRKRISFLLFLGAVSIALLTIPWAAERPRAVPATPEGRAIFAGGCFWCMEEAFEGMPGVRSVTSGFAGGTVANPTYAQVSSGGTGHLEVVEVVFDPQAISYEELLDRYWVNIDPENPDGQFCDFGEQYRAAIFAMTSSQGRAAELSKQRLLQSRRWLRFATEIRPAAEFYPADKRHQDYYRKNPLSYRYYKKTCGRAARLGYVWGVIVDRRP
jgi:peptide-methionine (S)-S-oxide reductase